MVEYLQNIIKFSLLTFVVCSMLAMGMSQRLADVIAPLRNMRMVVRALLLNFLVAPLLVLLLTWLFELRPAHAVGLMLLGVAGGAPFIPKLAELAGGSMAFSVSIMFLLMVGTVVFMPVLLPVFVPGSSVDACNIAKPLLLMIMFPLMIGFALGRIPGIPDPAREKLLLFLRRLSNIALILALLLLLGGNFKMLKGVFGSSAFASYIVFVILMVSLGYAFGGNEPGTRSVFALAAGQRNIMAAIVVAEANFDNHEVIVMLLVAVMVGLLLMLALARAMRTLRA